MTAAVQVGYGSAADSLRLGEVADPELRPGEVIVHVHGSTLNRKDLFALANLTGPGIRPRPPLPHVNGTDAWGTVAAAGPGTGPWSPGDRVIVYPGLFCGACRYCVRGETSACLDYGVVGEQRWGAHAEYLAVPARNLVPVAAGLSPEALACAGGSWLTAWRALITVAQIRPGETVLVVGASGGVGTAAVRIARAAGCRVIAVVRTASKAGRMLEIGADATVLAGGDVRGQVMDLTNGRGAEVALDSVGGSGWRDIINSLAPLGRMVICGATAGDSPAISVREIYQQHRRILGAPLGTRAEFEALVHALSIGILEPVVHTVLPLERIHEGLELLAAGHFVGKIAITVAEEHA